MIKDYPYKLDENILPWPDNPPEEQHGNVENVSVSEAGTDIVQTTRRGKITLPFSYQLPGSYVEMFDRYADSTNTIEVSIPRPSGDGYDIRTMRMDGYSKKMIKGSERLTGTSGVWAIKFNLIEM